MSWSESWWVTRNIVKSIQKGKTTSALSVTINKVDTTRSIVLSVSKGSAGYVASRGTVAKSTSYFVERTSGVGPLYIHGLTNEYNRGSTLNVDSGKPTSALRIETDPTTISGGSTDLTVKEYSATLTSPTTLVTDGACEWQVIEFY